MTQWDTDFTGGARLRRARNFQRLTLNDLGQVFGVSDETVRRWETGETVPQTYYRKTVDGFIQNAERIMLSQLAPRARFDVKPIAWVGNIDAK